MEVTTRVMSGGVEMAITPLLDRIANEVRRYSFNLFKARVLIVQEMDPLDPTIRISLSAMLPSSVASPRVDLSPTVGSLFSRVPEVEIVRTRTVSLAVLEYTRMPLGDLIRHEMQDLIRGLLMHEMDEWFLYDGQHVNDPHPELRSAKS